MQKNERFWGGSFFVAFLLFFFLYLLKKRKLCYSFLLNLGSDKGISKSVAAHASIS
jgi:hypothetical protein